MKKLPLLIVAGLLFGVASCVTTDQKNETPAQETTNKTDIEPTNKEAAVNVKEVVTNVDQRRAEIEAMSKSMEPLEIDTKELRAKVAQKWSKIHFYASEGELRRVKTYPHEGISNRTEEFYFDNGKLILAVIEDDGSGEAGKTKDQLDKMYYYANGEFVTESENAEEKEYQINKSDAEELMQEALEYQDIFASKQ